MKEDASKWFKELRDSICEEFKNIEIEYAKKKNLEVPSFERKNWNRDGGGGGEISVMKGNVFEKVGVNFSEVHGEFSEQFRKQIPGADEDPTFFACGISLVAHMASPLAPAAHFNTRFIQTQKSWFGGGGDLTPTFPLDSETELFHKYFKKACDKYDDSYYPKFSKECDEYFYLPHRKEHRGVGGIFFDYLNSGNQKTDFEFVKDVGRNFRDSFSKITRNKMYEEYTNEQKETQLYKRGRYVEFNLLHDRGTKFGLMTNGNIDAILMSLPPVAKWP